MLASIANEDNDQQHTVIPEGVYTLKEYVDEHLKAFTVEDGEIVRNVISIDYQRCAQSFMEHDALAGVHAHWLDDGGIAVTADQRSAESVKESA